MLPVCDDPDPDPNDPDGDPNSGGSGDGDIPEDLAELPEDPLVALARAVHALAQSSLCTGDSASKTKVHEPNTFDGSNHKKLHKFLIQCELNFQDHPCTFCSDWVKVTFTQSYLKGMALAWFKPDLPNPDNYDCPLWMDNSHEFLQELTANFGPHDAIADAVQRLENLTMKDSSQITKYVHGVQSLGFTDHIKDEIAHIGKPSTLTHLCKPAQTIDACYWECKAEISCTTKSTTNKSQSSTVSQSVESW
ncbi:hypothetical protein M404DRAFT_33993 [Pisolithus tinctorius Marx 270]|uniref:DUF4939 domain-containing protein n=1 Tax=Pisolithus tinctorius Marx 270 TaxID=870435 RepID=A0A0C3IF02_PISTI|nr:hypothetical protein M404DRAFT_33993 [Pisolithus tinctorius Marx 270]